MEDYESPTEETTLLAKHRRDMESKSTTSLYVESNISNMEFQWKWQKIRFYLVEPMVLILVFAYNLSATVLKNQIIFQTCTVIFDYNTTDCQQLSTKNTSDYIKAIEEEIQPYAARFFMITSVIESLVPALCGSFVGAWSDRFGRKPLLIASFTGYFLFYLVTSFISHLSDSYPVSPWYYLLASLPLSLLGDGVTYSIATLCYISDVSTAKEKPYRMTFYEAVMYIGLMTGSFTSGFIYEDCNSGTFIFSISALCIMFAILITIFVIPESLNTHTIQPNAAIEQAITATAEQQQRFTKLFDIQHLRDMYKTCFKARECEMRSVILLIIGSLLTCAFVIEGSTSVFYLFIREKFHWTVKEYTTYEAISILVPILGNIVGIWLLRKVLKIKLLNVAILGLLSHVCNCLMKGFAAINWQLYLAVLLGILKSIVNPMLRTVLTNLVPTNELGKLFSFTSVLQALVPFVATPLYTIVYSSTLKSFPGFFNILSANIFLLAICLILVVFRKKQKYPSYYNVIIN